MTFSGRLESALDTKQWDYALSLAANEYIACMRDATNGHHGQWLHLVRDDDEFFSAIRSNKETFSEMHYYKEVFRQCLKRGANVEQIMGNNKNETLFQYLNTLDMWELVIIAIPYVNWSSPPAFFGPSSDKLPYLVWLHKYKSDSMVAGNYYRNKTSMFGVPADVYYEAYEYAGPVQRNEINGYKDTTDYTSDQVTALNTRQYIPERYLDDIVESFKTKTKLKQNVC